jgi:hypothetical protein
MTTNAETAAWVAPFNGNVVEHVACPACEAEAVCVREDSSEDPRPAYCETCHALLTVEVFETFRNAALLHRPTGPYQHTVPTKDPEANRLLDTLNKATTEMLEEAGLWPTK